MKAFTQALMLAATAALACAWSGAAPVRPGGHVETMTLVRGTSVQSDVKLFDSDRILYAFPPAGGKDVVLREWKVMLVGATPGRHSLRYRSRTGSAPATDATWTFVVAK